MNVIIDLFSGTEGKRYAAGAPIFNKGDTGQVMYVILEGTVELKIGRNVVLTLGPGEPFGEMSLIDNSPRVASAVCKTACRLVEISEDKFLFLIQDTPYFALEIMKVMANRLRTMDTRAAARG